MLNNNEGNLTAKRFNPKIFTKSATMYVGKGDWPPLIHVSKYNGRRSPVISVRFELIDFALTDNKTSSTLFPPRIKLIIKNAMRKAMPE